VRVEAEISPQDFKAAIKALWRRNKKHPSSDGARRKRRTRLVVGWIALVIVMMIPFRLMKAGSIGPASLVVIAAVVFCGLFVFFLFDAQRRSQPDEDGPTLGPRTFEITSDGLIESSPLYESITRWPAVRAIEETPTHLFFVIDRCSVQIVPKRCFQSEMQAAEFLAQARAQMDERPVADGA